ncbi:hypothetical protein STCU_07846 [Strigomonas culicis]|nr:hypothetical protein STCU_07846 [Strigomonas culicis]|eukprot:EPY23149.1 hypothetical protein STCU_07846 [Strigomonas culicis]
MDYAGFSGNVYGTILFLDNGGSLKWKPDSLSLPNNAEGFLIVKSDGTWSYLAFSFYSTTSFLCEKKGTTTTTSTSTSTSTSTTTTSTSTTTTVAPTSTTTSTSTAPVSTTTSTSTTTTTTTTVAPTTTLAPEEDVSVASVAKNVKEVLEQKASFSILVNTTNPIALSTTAQLSLSVSALWASGKSIYIGFGCSDMSKVVVAALLPGDSAVHFTVPYSIVLAAGTHSICVLGDNNSFTQVYSATSPTVKETTSASVKVIAFETVLRSLKQSIPIYATNDLTRSGQTGNLTFAGEGTLVADTTAIAPVPGLTFSMVNNGVNGNPCTPSKLPLDFMIIGHKFLFDISDTYIFYMLKGRKSVCVSYKSTQVVVASLDEVSLASSTTALSFAHDSPIPVNISGVSKVALARGLLTAFISSESKCSSVARTVDLYVFNTFSQQGQDAFIRVSSVSDGDAKRYLCLQHTETSTRVPVTFEGKASYVVSSAVTIAPAKLTVFYGMKGTVNLNSYSQLMSSATVKNLLSVDQFVRFVPLTFTSTVASDEKASACSGNVQQEATVSAEAGILQLTHPLRLSKTSGVLCIDKVYIGVDYTVLKPSDWLLTIDQLSTFEQQTFFLSGSPSLDVASMELEGSNYGDLAVQLDADGTCDGSSYTSVFAFNGNNYMVLPEGASGTYTVCAGLKGQGTAAFVSTTRIINMYPLDAGIAAWKTTMGVSSHEWSSCAGSSACGMTTTAAYSQVCNAQAMLSSVLFPLRLEEEVNYVGAMEVQLSGSDVSIPAGFSATRFFIAVEYSALQCIQYSAVDASSDLDSFSESAVVTANQSLLYFSSSYDLSGMRIGLVLWDSPCAAGNLIFQSFVSLGSLSFIDLSELVFTGKDGYYSLCYPVDKEKWLAAGDTVVKVFLQNSSSAPSIEAIGTVTASSTSNSIILWRTQALTWWTLVGFFSSSSSTYFQLVWDDATCKATAVYSAAVTYVSQTSALVSIDVASISDAPTESSVLYACYLNNGELQAQPLPFEKHRSRNVALRGLTLTSLNYLPYVSFSYDTSEDATVQITDPDDPPLSLVAAFLATSTSGWTDSAACSTSNTNYKYTFSVSVDEYNRRRFTIPASLIKSVGATDETTYLLLCASASYTSAQFQYVTSYIAVNGWSAEATVNLVALNYVFTPLNASGDVLDLDGATSALQGYAKETCDASVDDVLVTKRALNRYSLYMEPSKTLTVSAAVTQTECIYAAMGKGTNLPLYATSKNSSMFVASAVEGVFLSNQSSHTDYPFITLVTQEPATSSSSSTTICIKLFCVVVAPTAIGFVAFSVQRSIPQLSHEKIEKKEVFPEAGDSPPPRNPQAAPRHEGTDKDKGKVAPPDIAPPAGPTAKEKRLHPVAVQMPLSVVAKTEDTAANPLYDSDEREEVKDMGRSPPVTNATFVMNRK